MQHQGPPADYGGQQSQASAQAPNVQNAPVQGAIPQAQPTYQQYQSPPQQQQQQSQKPPREKKILAFVNPETKENIMDQVIKEMEETQEKQHQQYVQGGLWKPPPGQQPVVDASDRRPSRSASATPHSTTGQGPDMVQVSSLFSFLFANI